MIRMGFWGLLITIIVEHTLKPYSNYWGPYIKAHYVLDERPLRSPILFMKALTLTGLFV